MNNYDLKFKYKMKFNAQSKSSKIAKSTYRPIWKDILLFGKFAMFIKKRQ